MINKALIIFDYSSRIIINNAYYTLIQRLSAYLLRIISSDWRKNTTGPFT